MATAEVEALFADDGVVGTGEGEDEVVDVGLLSSFDHFILAGVGVGKQQILTNRGVEEVGILGDDGDELADVVLRVGT